MSATPGKRERTKAQNRAAILDAARRAFADLGYGATTVRDIVRRTDLAAGTFYNYFPDKESVFRALVEEVATVTRGRLREARASAHTLEEFVGDGFRAYFASLAAEPAALAFMRRNAGTIRTMFDEPVLGAGVEELRADLEAAIVAGRLPPFEITYMAGAMIGAAFELALRMSEREPPDVEGAARFASALFLGGIERLTRED